MSEVVRLEKRGERIIVLLITCMVLPVILGQKQELPWVVVIYLVTHLRDIMGWVEF